MNQERSITGVIESELWEIINTDAADMGRARQELKEADQLGSQAAIYADGAADMIRAVIDHTDEGGRRRYLKEIQAYILAAGVNAQMTVYRIRDAGNTIKGKGER